MNKHRNTPCLANSCLAAVLALMGGLYSLRAHADTLLVNPDSIPRLRPHTTATAAKDGTLPLALQQRLQQEKPVPDSPVGLDGKDHNLAYRKRHPHPQMVCVRTHPFIPFDGERPGVERVEGFDISWQEGVKATSETERREVHWQWQAPAELKKSWGDWSIPWNDTDRYAALSLTPVRWADRNPTLCCFDAVSGLKWMVEVPLDTTMQEAAPRLPQPWAYTTRETVWEAHDAQVSIAEDGSRLVTSYPRLDKNVVVTFIYDGKGTLLRTLLFPGCTSHSALLLGRISGNLFSVNWYRSPIEQGKTLSGPRHDEFYLLDGEGNLRFRFDDAEGNPVLALPRLFKDGVTVHLEDRGKHYLYALPPKVNHTTP